MSAPFIYQLQEPWTRFSHGDFECTVVSDGLIHMGRPHPTLPNADESEIDRLLNEYFLPTDALAFDQNILVVNTGKHLVLFDTGCGKDSEFGARTFGPQVGEMIANLRMAGIDPADIDVIALTHAHPDHCWGLADEQGRALFPNASVAIDRGELEYWTDLKNLPAIEYGETDPSEREFFAGARKNLLPYMEQGRIILVTNGTDIVPGISAFDTAGHTPGHTSYKIESDGQTMVVWGDLCHHHVLLLQHPEWNFIADVNIAEAKARRKHVLADVARQRFTVLAYHFPFPGHGHLREENGHYHWLPSPLQLY